MKTLKKIYDGFTLLEKIVISALFMFITVAIVFDVIRRKTAGISLPWIEELARYTLVYCTMICASMGITTDGHARMDAVTGLLKGRFKKVVRILSNIIPSVGCFYLCYWAYMHVQKMSTVGTMTTTLHIPLWYCYLIMPLGMAGIAVRSLALVIKDIIHFNEEDKPVVDEETAELEIAAQQIEASEKEADRT